MIVRFLKWALSKFEPKPTLKEQLTAWPFPTEEAPKTKPKVAKATTRVRKTRDLPSRATIAKKALSKKAK